MIGWLRGTVRDVDRSSIVVAAGGIGYQVGVIAPLMSAFRPGQLVELWVRTIVRADAIALFGFLEREEREAFDALIGVSGVGPHLALAILSALRPQELWEAVASEDVGRLTAVSGVGHKIARRLALELGPRARAERGHEVHEATARSADLRAALVELGFRAGEIESVVGRCPAELDLESQLRWALRELAR